MRIVIIGTNGFLSTAIAKYFYAKGWWVDMYGLEEPNHPYHTYSSLNVLKEDIDYETMLMSDVIVYASGAGIQSNLNEDANLVYALNTFAPIRICKLLRDWDYKGVFITFGSYFELGESNLQQSAVELDIISSQAPAPTDYVVSKRLLTRFVTSYKHDFTHWHFILPTIFGPGENPQRLIPYTISTIYNNEKPCFTSGNQVRQYLYVEDVTKYIETAVQCGLPSGLYNIAGSTNLSVKEIVESIARRMNVILDTNVFGTEDRSDVKMQYLALDDSKLKKYMYVETTKFEEVLNLYLV